jgi:hypothetical protein
MTTSSRIEETFDLLAGAKYFSCVDLASGYWQVELEEEDSLVRCLIGALIPVLIESFTSPVQPMLDGDFENRSSYFWSSLVSLSFCLC